MTHQVADAAPSVDLTASAAKRVAEILKGEGTGAALRVGVDGGGCSRVPIHLRHRHRPRGPTTLVLERDGATVLIDQTSLPFLQGARIDFVNDLMGSAFKIHNPQATSSCGCGVSFAV